MGILAAIFGGGSTELEDRTEGSPTGTQTRDSSPRPQPKPNIISRTASNVARGIRRDLSMGLSTFGQTGERQAETLREAGYSDEAIRDYQERTAASQERMRQSMMSQRDDGDRPSLVTEAAPETTEPAAPEQDIGVPKGTRTAAGAAVAEAEETGRRGRRQTIGTTMKGLTTEPETAGRRSLMGLIR